MHRAVWTVLGFLVGIVFYVACNGSDGHSAAAASDCNSWSVTVAAGKQCDGNNICAIPAGWEPFAIESGDVFIRRCED